MAAIAPAGGVIPPGVPPGAPPGGGAPVPPLVASSAAGGAVGGGAGALPALSPNEALLHLTLGRFIGIPPRTVKDHPICKALVGQGFRGWTDFISMTAEQIEKLTIPNTGSGSSRKPVKELGMAHQTFLRSLLAFYHHESYKIKAPIDINDQVKYSNLAFDNFRISAYDPINKLLPWWLMGANTDNLATWSKNIKPSGRDFKAFREITQWYETKENMEITFDSQNMNHLINEHYVPTDIALHRAQQKFYYKILKDTMLHHEARSIVKKHRIDKNIALIWKELCAFYDDSVTVSLASDQLLCYLTSADLAKSNWRKG